MKPTALPSSLRNFVIYELNEISPPYLRTLCSRFPDSTLASILTSGTVASTSVSTSIELHPWSTWPTFHHGINIDEHSYRFLNQEEQTNISQDTLWQHYLDHGKTVGIYGVLQSHLKQPFPPNLSFFVPDSFSSLPSFPTAADSLQSLNLAALSLRDSTTSGPKILKLLQAIASLVTTSLLPTSVLLPLLSQLKNEIKYSHQSILRPIAYADFNFDCFFHLLSSFTPDLSIFFTNHLAAIMHRYLQFDPSFKSYSQPSSPFHRVYADCLNKAFLAADNHLSKLRDWCIANNQTLIVLSSMGQVPITQTDLGRSPSISSFKRLLTRLSLNPYVQSILPAMFPDYVLDLTHSNSLHYVYSTLRSVTTLSNQPVFNFPYLQHCSQRLHFNLNTSLSAEDRLIFKNKPITFEELGVSFFDRGMATAYHDPTGVLLIDDHNNQHIPTIPLSKLRNFLLNY